MTWQAGGNFNPASITEPPSEIGGVVQLLPRYVVRPKLGHSARLATDKSVGVPPLRGLSAGFAGRVGSSEPTSHIGQARLRRDSSDWSSRLTLRQEAPQRSPQPEPTYVTLMVTLAPSVGNRY
ncbi:hypothetical protein Taro_027129 [Colocasia esculenta]|uniref:Uncharacterized protein n=1 Tax=Colocasia esculenta TaxID=4460 RepID=A0A843VQQ7_COLES|nr:hypothetical protein [Colocasia esculenta]